jgi:hypothetical protein
MSIGDMRENNNEWWRPPGTNIVNYTQATRAQRLSEADRALVEELEKDSDVQAARAALEQAQAKLQLAQAHRNTVPYVAYNRRNDQRHRDWQNAVAAVQEAKGAVATAEKALGVARNDAASARIQGRFRQEEKERAERQEREQAQFAMLEEAEAKEKAWAAYVAVGGTADMFESYWPGHWKRIVAARAEERLGAQERELRASGRYQL